MERRQYERIAIRSGATKMRPSKEKELLLENGEVDTQRFGQVLDFMRVVWSVAHGLHSASKQMESQIGVTGPQRLVIRILGRLPGISAGRLARTLHIHPSTLTGILQRLERRQLITRATDPSDARRALFTLTDKGKEIDALRAGTVENIVRRALAKLPRDKVEVAQEVLTTLAKELERGP